MLIERKPAKISNQQFLNALLYVLKKVLQMEGFAEKVREAAHDLHEFWLMA